MQLRHRDDRFGLVVWLAAALLFSTSLCSLAAETGFPEGAAPPLSSERALPPAPPAGSGAGTAPPPEKVGERHPLSWETGEGRSYLIPALEVPAFVLLLNGFDRLAFPNKIKDGKNAYRTTPSTVWEHLHEQHWGFDHDSFEVNQFGHPYEGATFYGLARSSGLNFWESLGYSHAGSFLWEMAGETSRPSINDIITTGNAGSLLGEALFRIAGVVLEDGGEKPGMWHEIAAAVLSPPTGFNRAVFPERFKSTFPSRKPATYWRLRLGASVGAEGDDRGHGQAPNSVYGIADFSFSYGLPGRQGYRYERPLDYFDLRGSVRARGGSNFLESLLLRGLLVGAPYEGDLYRGVWGLYGSYDYLSLMLFHLSSTALSLGTTAECLVAPDVTLQGSLLGGVGFAASGSKMPSEAERDFHFGYSPQWLAALNILFGKRAYLDLSARGYYHQAVETDITGSENLYLGDLGVTFRISGRHGVGVRWMESLRSSHYLQLPNRHQREGTVSLFYSWLSDTAFGRTVSR